MSEERIKGLPPAGKPVVFKIGELTREDIKWLRLYIADRIGRETPLTVSEVCRAAIRMVAGRARDYLRQIDTKRAQDGVEEL